jgi:hypothetical protein
MSVAVLNATALARMAAQKIEKIFSSSLQFGKPWQVRASLRHRAKRML